MLTTVLVAGGAGFIGKNLCKYLLSTKKYNVICIDNLKTGFIDSHYRFEGNRNYTFIHHDIRHTLNINQDVDVVINLACPASPPWYQEFPIYTLLTSVAGTSNLLQLASIKRARFIHASTSEVYGNPEVHPQDEDYVGAVSTGGVRSCYEEGKRAAETLCYDFNRSKCVDVTILRLFNCFGPGMRRDDGRVISNFVWQALQSEDMTVYGNGGQTRSFCYIDDMIRLFAILVEGDSPGLGPFNAGNPEEISVGDLAILVKAIVDSGSSVKYLPAADDDPIRRRPDISRIAGRLGWRPTICLSDGLKRYVKHVKSETLANDSLAFQEMD